MSSEPHTLAANSTQGVGPKYDSGKTRYDLVPPFAIKAIADILTFGAAKYAPNSWQTVPDGEARYTAAMMRHFEAYRAGEEFDDETGESHLSHCLCNLTFLLWFQRKRLATSISSLPALPTLQTKGH